MLATLDLKGTSSRGPGFQGFGIFFRGDGTSDDNGAGYGRYWLAMPETGSLVTEK